MKKIATISTMIVAAVMAAAQTSPAYKPAAPASQSPVTKSPAATTTTTTTKTTAKAATTTAAKPAAAKQAATPGVEKRRDPFVSPVIVRLGAAGGSACTGTGKKCLSIDQLSVDGVVCKRLDMDTPVERGKAHNCREWIAVVGNPAKKVYYVRENDALFDGYVARITGDSVVFRQNVIDALGKTVQRDVVKRVAPSA